MIKKNTQPLNLEASMIQMQKPSEASSPATISKNGHLNSAINEKDNDKEVVVEQHKKDEAMNDSI